jgi:hypothetical protein
MINGIILTVKLQGRLAESKSNSSSRRMQRKLLSSPYEYEIRDKKGGGTGKFITPAENFKAPNNFTQREEIPCCRKINISDEVVKEWISKPPYFIKEYHWKTMSKTQRLRSWIYTFDEGFGVEFQEL